MSSTTELKNEIQRGLRAYKAFEYGERALSLLEGIEQNVKETEKRLASLQVEEASLSEVKKQAHDEAEKMKEQARADIKVMLEKSAALVQKQVKSAEKSLSELQEIADKSQQEHEETLAKIASAKSAHAELNSAITKRKAELSELDALKEKARKALGA